MEESVVSDEAEHERHEESFVEEVEVQEPLLHDAAVLRGCAWH